MQMRYPLHRFAVSTMLRTWWPPLCFKTVPRVHTPLEGGKGLIPFSLRRFTFIAPFHQKESLARQPMSYPELGHFPHPSHYVHPGTAVG